MNRPTKRSTPPDPKSLGDEVIRRTRTQRHVLVLGATGYIGGRLVRDCCRPGTRFGLGCGDRRSSSRFHGQPTLT